MHACAHFNHFFSFRRVQAIEFEQELVVLPSWLSISTIGVKALFELEGKLGIRTPFASPMKSFDDSQAQRAFHAIEQHSKL
jgi:hypothetical protein